MELRVVVLFCCALYISMIASLPNETGNLKQGIGADGDWGDKGQKGERGYPGSVGAKGFKGDPGERGFPGLFGRPGLPGFRGYPGLKGMKGSTGRSLKGLKGEKGDPYIQPGEVIDVSDFIGRSGEPGIQGPRGELGDIGFPGRPGVAGFPGAVGVQGVNGPPGPDGDVGFPGPMGLPGICSKENTRSVLSNFTTNEITKILSCKNGIITDTATDGHKVTCQFEGTKVCIKYASDKVINYKDLKHPFWLSSKNVEFKDIYGLDIKPLTWLQRSSYMSNLTIRYHCLYSNPNDVTLLSWNNVAIGPEPTATSSVQYSIQNDGCSTSPKDKWSSTDIVLTSDIAPIFPIIDIFIRDIKNELFRRKNKAFRIEILNMCVE